MNDLEVKVGQVWVNKKSGLDYAVVYVNDSEVTLSGKDEGVFRLDICPQFFEKFTLKLDALNHRDEDETITLRDHFAGLAMQGWLASYGENDSHPVVNGDDIKFATMAYKLADAMIKARGE